MSGDSLGRDSWEEGYYMISWEGVQGAARTHLLGSPGYLCHLPPSLTGTWFPDDLPGVSPEDKCTPVQGGRPDMGG